MLNQVFWQKAFCWFWITALVFLFFVLAVQIAFGRIYDYERQTLLARERRFGEETDEFRPVGGRAEITASAIFENGVHLESLEQSAMAVAIYQFEEVDKRASSLAIQIAYRGAGKVFVAREKEFGVTFELPADQDRQTLYLAANYVGDDGIVEIHVITDNMRKLDIQFIELESLRYKPEVRVIERYTYLPPKYYPRTVYWYYYRGPVYTLVRPYEYIVYDSWWDDSWYIGWRAGFRVRTYPVYRYYWRPDRVVHIHHHYDQSEPTVVRELPRSRESVRYTETQRRRPEASRSRLDMIRESRPTVREAPQIQENTQIKRRREQAKPRPVETSRISVRYRPDSSAQWQTITPSRPSSEVRTKQRREESPAPAQTQRESSSRSQTIKQRRVESSSSSSQTRDDDDENRKKRRR